MTNGPSIEDRYVWFCVMGWKKPVLNDPRIVDGIATPQDVDAMIREGMQRWPLECVAPPPQEAA